MKQFEKIEGYPHELKGRMNSFVYNEFDDSLTPEKQMRSLIRWVRKNIELTNEMVEYLNTFIETFDSNLYKTTSEILTEWKNNGVFNELFIHSVFNDLQAEIDKKANSEDVRLKKDKITANDLSSDLLAEWNKGGNLTVLSEVADNSITLENIKFTETPINLFNKDNVVDGFYVQMETGNLVVNPLMTASAFIPVQENSFMMLFGTDQQFCYYDTNRKYVSGVAKPTGLFQVPKGVSFIRLTVPKTLLPTTTLYYGSKEKIYLPFSKKMLGKNIADKSIPYRANEQSYLASDSSPNLFNRFNIDRGYYVDYKTGSYYPNNQSCVAIIRIKPETTYKIVNTNQQFCIVNSKWEYLTGRINHNGTINTPENSYYLLITLLLDDIYYAQICEDGKLNDYYVSGSPLRNIDVPDNTLDENKLAFSSVWNTDESFNMVDNIKIIKGKYIANWNGYEVEKEGTNCTDFISISSKQMYELLGTNQQLAFYDYAKKYISGVVWGIDLEKTDIPSNARFIRLTFLDGEEIVLRNKYEIPSRYIGSDALTKISNELGFDMTNDIIHVKKDGDIKTIKAALELSKEGTKIVVHGGLDGYNTYSLSEEYTLDEMKKSNFFGWSLKDNVKIVGIGFVKLDVDLPIEISDSKVKDVSGFHYLGNATVDNFFIHAKRCRYGIHADNPNANLVNIKNIVGLRDKVGTYAQFLGGGLYENQTHSYENCEFETKWDGANDTPFSYHDNTNFNLPSKVICTNVKLKGKMSARFGSMKSNVINEVSFNGCDVSSVWLYGETGATTNTFMFTGGNNTPIKFINSTLSENIIINMTSDYTIQK